VWQRLRWWGWLRRRSPTACCAASGVTDRTTVIGQILNAYLTKDRELDDHAVHLLFSANRWERASDLQSLLSSGTHVVVDRYAHSGVAFSGAKPGMSLAWCKQADVGLPAPDVVFYMHVAPEVARARGGFGAERYEVDDFQRRVKQNYDLLAVRPPV
jgi:dTMP kinase